ncbi:MAG: hypothetical protein DMG79_21570 [Acidobacteria bacterium]|nr:MAG: hypothetical protein DMG79_21570 [Acidobacteriota bacterium]
MRAVFALLLSKERLNQSVPLTILAFKNDKSYYQVAPLHQGQPIGVPGFFLLGEDQDFIVLNLFEDEPWRAVAHDFALMLLNYNYPPAQSRRIFQLDSRRQQAGRTWWRPRTHSLAHAGLTFQSARHPSSQVAH